MANETEIYDRSAVADVMALADTYADTAAINGIRSSWAQMARASLEGALLKIKSEQEAKKLIVWRGAEAAAALARQHKEKS